MSTKATFLAEATREDTPSDRLVAIVEYSLSENNLVLQDNGWRGKYYRPSPVLEAVARHPNAPWSLLKSLLTQQTLSRSKGEPLYGDAVLENPALALHKVAEPEWPFPITTKGLYTLARRPEALARALFWPDPEDLEADIGALQLSLWWFGQIDASRFQQHYWARSEVKSRHELQSRWFRVWLQERSLSPTILRRILKLGGREFEHQHLATTSEAPWVLEALAGYPHLHMALARNRHTPEYLLDIFAEQGDSMLRAAVASNLYASTPTLLRLARDDSKMVRSEVVNRSAKPAPEVLALLRHDVDLKIRQRARAR